MALGDGGRGGAATASWGSVLQEKYVAARAVACCPSMDLVAVLTTDRQLAVHRTISWQRILHIKPTEVFVTMETLAWSPDGMRLAVGCDEGELVVFSMETVGDDKGVEIKPHTTDDTLRHETAIVAMHWVKLRDAAARDPSPAAMLRDRSAAFVVGAQDAVMVRTEEASVLVTADANGRIGVWWNGLVLVAVIPLHEQCEATDQNALAVHAVMLATDLSELFVDVSYVEAQDSQRLRDVVRIDLRSSLQALHRDLGSVSRVGFEVRSIFETIRTSLRQVTSEWKNATRVFELKMSLIGSLYEKYGNKDPPQVDMLAIVAGGITPPALAQYFAQDIQEMSVIRMQKMFFSGCDTIQSLVQSKIVNGLQQILFEVAELRGTVKWNHQAFSETLGIATHDLDAAIENVSTLIAAMEQIGKAVHETRQDFVLLFSWLLERIRIHTNDGSARPGSTVAAAQVSDGTSTSLLNIRRLVSFLERAAHAAKAYQVKKNNNFLVEVTFGNPVSRLVSSPTLVQGVTNADTHWGDIMTRMIRALSTSLGASQSRRLTLGDDVDEVLLHTRWIKSSPWDDQQLEDRILSDGEESSEEEGGEGFDALEAVDWDSLESICAGKAAEARDRVPVTVVAVRRAHSIAFLTSTEGSVDTQWDVGSVTLDFLCHGASACTAKHHISLYGGTNSGKQEQLVVAELHYEAPGQSGIYLVNYDTALRASRARNQVLGVSSLHDKIGASAISIPSGANVKWRGFQSSRSSYGQGAKTEVISQASRGVVCVISGNTRLLVLDAEEVADEEEGSEEDDTEGVTVRHGDADSDDHAEVDL